MSEPSNSLPAARLRLDEFLPYRLSFTSNLVSGAIARAYEALFGLKIPEWRLVAVIAEADAATQQAIGARTRMDKVTVSRAAAALVERGVLSRQANEADKRSHLLALTDEGRALHARIAPMALELEAKIFGEFTPEELATLMRLLRRIDTATLAVTPGVKT